MLDTSKIDDLLQDPIRVYQIYFSILYILRELGPSSNYFNCIREESTSVVSECLVKFNIDDFVIKAEEDFQNSSSYLGDLSKTLTKEFRETLMNFLEYLGVTRVAESIRYRSLDECQKTVESISSKIRNETLSFESDKYKLLAKGYSEVVNKILENIENIFEDISLEDIKRYLSLWEKYVKTRIKVYELKAYIEEPLKLTYIGIATRKDSLITTQSDISKAGIQLPYNLTIYSDILLGLAKAGLIWRYERKTPGYYIYLLIPAPLNELNIRKPNSNK